jgi:hypothetical protein
MNTPTASALILAAVLSVSTSSPSYASSKNETPIAYSVNTVTVTSNGDVKIVRGMYRGDVSWALRYKSHEELAPNVWVVSGYQANLDLVNDQGCETLVITFADDKVVDLQLVNRPAIAAIATNLKLGSPAKNIASR